ncbi:aminopeptidase 1 [uncultured archaeon]|nr:aminopeptidase 1 [uncultured archaeon]
MADHKTGWSLIDNSSEAKLNEISRGYINFLNSVKTEFEAVDYFIERLERNEFSNIENSEKLRPGSKFYLNHMGRTLAAGIIGKKGIDNGLFVIASHIDSPRIDLKPKPVYEDVETNTVLLKTQYYGGVKKYQWVNRSLALHGRVYTKGGREIKLRIGEEPDDPVFVIPDLLPHIADKVQGERKLFEGIKGEEMNAIFGSIPGQTRKDQFKNNVLKILKDRYDIEEEDLASADLYLVPSDKARESGLDASMIGGYGHDDKASSYACFHAFMDIEKPDDTVLVLFYDKEEIGSMGATGSQSNLLEYLVTQVIHKLKGNADHLEVLSLLRKSKVISSDVDAAMDPSFKDAHDTYNAAKLGGGIVITKYTGSGGKFMSSEAPAEFVAYLRNIFEKHKVKYQFGTLGKVDEGGGGTVAQDFARYGMSVIDAGPPVLGMHSPFELVSKVDMWSSYHAYLAFMMH